MKEEKSDYFVLASRWLRLTPLGDVLTRIRQYMEGPRSIHMEEKKPEEEKKPDDLVVVSWWMRGIPESIQTRIKDHMEGLHGIHQGEVSDFFVEELLKQTKKYRMAAGRDTAIEWNVANEEIAGKLKILLRHGNKNEPNSDTSVALMSRFED